MERYSIELAIDVLRELNVFEQLDDWRSPEELCRALSFRPQFGPALKWLLERLVETECIERSRASEQRAGYRLRQQPWATDRGRIRALALQIDSANAATLDLLDHAASVYSAVASGEQTGEQCLFGPKGIALWLNYFNNSNLTYAVNNWVGAAEASTRLFDRSGLRILELGAGAGSGSETLLRVFAERGLLPRIKRYLITEPNAFFRRRAQRDLAARYPNVPLEFGTLDLNVPWSDQITADRKFDLVYAVNVLHVSKDLLFSLGQARTVLSEQGWLILGECIRPFPNQPIYPELMFQNLDSFINVQIDPDVRPHPGFLTAEQWRRAFNRAGFVGTEVTPDAEHVRTIYPHFFTGAVAGQKGNDDSSRRRS